MTKPKTFKEHFEAVTASAPPFPKNDVSMKSALSVGAVEDVNQALDTIIARNNHITTVDGDGAPSVRITFLTVKERNQFIDAIRELRAWSGKMDIVGKMMPWTAEDEKSFQEIMAPFRGSDE